MVVQRPEGSTEHRKPKSKSMGCGAEAPCSAPSTGQHLVPALRNAYGGKEPGDTDLGETLTGSRTLWGVKLQEL
jgi:hypothetical protein